MTRLLLDGRSLQDGSSVRGIGTYLRGLLGGFHAQGFGPEIELLLEGRAPLADGWSALGIRAHPFRLPRTNRHLRPFLDPWVVRGALGRRPPDLYHAVEYAQPLAPRVPVVVTVHDLIPFVMPHLYPWLRRERLVSLSQVHRADAVIAVSESTARDLERIARVDRARITVIPEAVEPHAPASPEELAAMTARLGLPARYVLAVGTFDPRKRIDALVEVVRSLRGEHDLGLVIAGFQGNFAETVRRAVEDAGLAGTTRILGHVSAADLRGLYQQTECLLFTSAYEGFGLPPLEAMSWGAPVAVFDNSSLAEVVGDAGILVPDGDTQAMAEAVATLIGEPDLRSAAAAAGIARAGTFSWAASARSTLELYGKVLGSSPLRPEAPGAAG